MDELAHVAMHCDVTYFANIVSLPVFPTRTPRTAVIGSSDGLGSLQDLRAKIVQASRVVCLPVCTYVRT